MIFSPTGKKRVYINTEQGLEEYAVNYEQEFILKECNWGSRAEVFQFVTLYTFFKWWFIGDFYFGDVLLYNLIPLEAM